MRSAIINDLVEGKITLGQALDRLLVIVLDLGDVETAAWIKREQAGYADDTSVPDYRVTKLEAFGSFFLVAHGGLEKFEHRKLALKDETDEIKQVMDRYEIRQGISFLEPQMAHMDNGETFGLALSCEQFKKFSAPLDCGNITNASLDIGDEAVRKIIIEVKLRVIELLVMYEKNLGSLDDFDITPLSMEETKKFNGLAKAIIQGNKNVNITIFEKSKVKNSNVSGSGKVDSRIDKKTNVNASLSVTNPEKKKGLLSWLRKK